jgi:serine/threonine protein phosphatase PrpC
MSDAREDKAEVAGSEPPAGLTATEQNGLSAATGAAELSGPGVNVRFAGRSSVGLVREHNEDNLVIANLTTGEIATRDAVQNDAVGEGGLLFAVCDGMGGAAAGEVASQMAVDILHEALRRNGPPRERDELARRLVSAVEEAGKRIFESAQKERSRRGMGTTATVAVLIDKVLFIAEVGDSRAYLLRGGMLKQLTKDQSLVNQLIEAGHLTEAEAEAFEHSNIILQALGTSETVQVDLTFVELRRGDRLMMCSDGLSGLVHVDSLRDTLLNVADPAECTAALTKYAEGGGGHDNITVLVVDFGGEGLPPLRETDSFGYLQYPLLPVAGTKSVYSDDEVTEATNSRSSGPPGPVHGQDDVIAQPGGGASSVLWVSFGIVALLGGAWILAVSGSNGSAAVQQAPVTEPQMAPADAKLASKPALPVEPKPVPVRVFSDVQDAVLLVNGEPHGPLTVGQAASMELKPGAYRFEAQTNGNIAAVEVATVRPEVPLEVKLNLPSGHAENEGEKATKPAAAVPSENPAEKPSEETAAAATKKPALEEGPNAAEKRAAARAARRRSLPDLNALPPAEAAPPPAAAPEKPAEKPAEKPHAPGTIPDNPFAQ